MRLAALRQLELTVTPVHAPEPARHNAQEEEKPRRHDAQNLVPQREVPECIHDRCPLLSKRARRAGERFATISDECAAIGLACVFAKSSPSIGSNDAHARESPAAG